MLTEGRGAGAGACERGSPWPWYAVLGGGALLGACAAAAAAVAAGRLRVVVVVDDGAPRLPARLRGPGVVHCVDCHCGGLPARVVLAGAPLAGEEAASCAARRERLMREHDGFRRLLLQEPRGYPCQNVDIVYPPTPRHPEARFSFVIGENAGVWPMMSGHNCICVCTALLETGLVPMAPDGQLTEFSLEAPAGLIRISAACAKGKAVSVSFTNAPCFCGPRDVLVRVPTLASHVKVDLCYGGMWYAVVDLDESHNATVPELRALAGLLPRQGGEIVRLGEMIKVATREQSPVRHPVLDDPGPSIMVFRCRPSAEARARGVHARNAVVMSTGALDWARPETWKGNIDRSPCGTGTCAVMALLAARGQLREGEDFVHESVLGSRFTGRIVGRATVGPYPAIVPQITGSAVVTQLSQVVVDPADPFPEGYTVGDIWADGGDVKVRSAA